MSETIINLLKESAEANLADAFRGGNVIHLPTAGRLIAAGDLHGHRLNFERIVAHANLQDNPRTHVVLQEIIHGGPEDTQGGCLSYKLLFDVLRYKLRFPNQVHIIMGNHDTAFVCETEVLRGSKQMNLAFNQAMQAEFRENCEDIKQAMKNYFLSQPLAVRCPDRIWLSHSLPSDLFVENFDKTVLKRPLTVDDLRKPAGVYLLTWGRKHTPATLRHFAQLLDTDIFVLGHQAQPEGFSKPADNLLIIASDHNHGCILDIDLEKRYTIDELENQIVPLASLHR